MAQRPKVIPDTIHPSMWRVQWPDGSLSDMANLTRAKDAAACFIETEERRHRGRQSLSEGRRCVVGTRMTRLVPYKKYTKRPCVGSAKPMAQRPRQSRR